MSRNKDQQCRRELKKLLSNHEVVEEDGCSMKVNNEIHECTFKSYEKMISYLQLHGFYGVPKPSTNICEVYFGMSIVCFNLWCELTINTPTLSSRKMQDCAITSRRWRCPITRFKRA